MTKARRNRLAWPALAGLVIAAIGCEKTYQIHFMSALPKAAEMEVDYDGVHKSIGRLQPNGTIPWAIKVKDNDRPVNIQWVARDPSDPTNELAGGAFSIASDRDKEMRIPVATKGYTGPIRKGDEVRREKQHKHQDKVEQEFEVTE